VKEILQKSIPYPVVWDAALPGVLPLRDDGWIIEDEGIVRLNLLEAGRAAL